MKHFYGRVWPRGPAVRGRHGPGQSAGRGGEGARFRAGVRERSGDRWPLLGCCRTSGSSPARPDGSEHRGDAHRCQVAEQSSPGFDTSASNSGLGWAWRWASRLSRAATSARSWCRSRSRRLLVSGSESSRSPSPRARRERGRCPWPTSRSATRHVTGTTASSSTSAIPTSPTPSSRQRPTPRQGGPAGRTTQVHGPSDLGRVFFFAEFGTAVTGWVLGINPFDQPNVQEAKDTRPRSWRCPSRRTYRRRTTMPCAS